jgi:hypothetical protein
MMCGHVPSQSPPGSTVDVGQGIPSWPSNVKRFWTPFHANLCFACIEITTPLPLAFDPVKPFMSVSVVPTFVVIGEESARLRRDARQADGNSQRESPGANAGIFETTLVTREILASRPVIDQRATI